MAGRFKIRALFRRSILWLGDNRRGIAAVPQPADIAHLLRRAGFGGTATQISTLAAQPWTTTVDQLLDFSSAPRRHRARVPHRRRHRRLGEGVQAPAWWLDRMATTTTPLQEKLTFFWHGHFATAQLQGRRHAADVSAERAVPFDRGRQLPRSRAADVVAAGDAASGSTTTPTTKGNPNENFARELMELFTLGVEQVHPGRRGRVGAGVDRSQHPRR